MLKLPALWWTLGALGVVIVIVLSLMPGPPGIPGDPEGWAGHTIAYATMMAWFSRLAGSRRGRLVAGLALCALGIGMEYAQRETGYRTFDVGDMLADAAGVTVGWLLSPPRVADGLAAADRRLAFWVKRDEGESR